MTLDSAIRYEHFPAYERIRILLAVWEEVAIVPSVAFSLTQDQMRHRATCVQEELRGGPCRFKPRLRLRDQRKGVQVQLALDHGDGLGITHETCNNPGPAAKLIGSGVLCENGGAELRGGVRLGHQANGVPLIFANALQHLGIRCVAHRQRDAQRLGQRLGIVESDLKLHVSEVDTPESLRYAQAFGMRVAGSIEPTPVIEP